MTHPAIGPDVAMGAVRVDRLMPQDRFHVDVDFAHRDLLALRSIGSISSTSSAWYFSRSAPTINAARDRAVDHVVLAIGIAMVLTIALSRR